MKKQGLNDKERASFSTLLANEMERALRAARVERATRWGTRVLWGGAFLVGLAAWRFERDAASVGRNVAVVLTLTACVAFFIALRQKTGTQNRRALALLAGRRLENRFPERRGVLVAAVDFCEEEPLEGSEEKGAISGVLRAETVASATRWHTELASTLDPNELLAVLADCSPARLRKIGKKRRFFVLGVLANIAIWAGTASWGEGDDAKRPSVRPSEPKIVSAPVEIQGNKRNKENGGTKRETKDARNKESVSIQGEENGGASEDISLASLELLISELAQNAEIAETLVMELQQAAVEENFAGERNEASSAATRALQLARELGANLARPSTGLVAQTRRLSAAAKRERRRIEARLVKKERFETWGGRGEINGIDEIQKEGGLQSARRIAGKEVALFLASARLSEWETALTTPGGVGDWKTLGLSRVLRSDSATECKRILTEAAARVDGWKTALRCEETAARILRESWRFDATSQRWLGLVKRAEEENRALLTRFAGRLSVDFDASNENAEELEEAKVQFNAIGRETQAAAKERVAIVERLLERLQSEEAQDFIVFARNGEEYLKGLTLWSDEADATASAALSVAGAQHEERWEKIAKDVENNRFGSAAERLEKIETTFVEGTAASFDENFATRESKSVAASNAAIENVGVVIEECETANGDDGDWRERRRFSALAAALTWGAEEKKAGEINLQTTENENVALYAKAKERRNASAKRKREDEEKSRKENGEIEGDTASQNGSEAQEKRSTEKKNAVNDVNDVKNDAWDALDDGSKDGESASGEDGGNEDKANAIGASGGFEAKSKEQDKMEALDNRAFNAELPPEARRRFEGTNAPEMIPEYEEKIRIYRRRVAEERR